MKFPNERRGNICTDALLLQDVRGLNNSVILSSIWTTEASGFLAL